MFPPAMDVQRGRSSVPRPHRRPASPAGARALPGAAGRAHRVRSATSTTACSAVRCWPAGTVRRAQGGTRRRSAPGNARSITPLDVMIDAAARDAEHSRPGGSPRSPTVNARPRHRGPHRRARAAAALLARPVRQRADAALAQAVAKYSIANAPRQDGTLRLHVRAVRGGLVVPPSCITSGLGPAGARRGRRRDDRGHGLAAGRPVPGGRHRAGPGQGDHRGDHRTPVPGRRREIVLYFGARHRQDLYDLAELQEMELAYPLAAGHPGGHPTSRPAIDVMFGTVAEPGRQATWPTGDIYRQRAGRDASDRADAEERGAPDHLTAYDLAARLANPAGR